MKPARMTVVRIASTCFVSWCCCSPAPAQAAAPAATDGQAFAAWADVHLRAVSLSSRAPESDLEALRRMIGDASLVAFGEGLHGAAEPLDFRNRLFRYLVERMGFTAIAIESGITESYAANAYVLGGPGDPAEIAARGITSGLGGFPQQATLLRWMREYNLDPRHARKIQFYGMDISASAGEPGSPFEQALQYLDAVDAKAAGALRERMQPMLAWLKIDRFADHPESYSHLPREKRDAATAVIADLVTLFETKETDYLRASSERSYELAYRSALAARQVDEYLRQVPVGWTPQSGPQAIIGTVAVADRAKLDNIEWIVKQQGRGGRVLVFAHVGHVAPTPVSVQLSEREALPLPPMVGMYLKPRYGEDLVTIGHLFAQDTTDCKATRDPAAPDAVEGLLAARRKPSFLLDLRTAPPAVREWLKPARGLYGQRPTHSFSLAEGVDVLLFTERATRATACP